jgi:hypothetical protein
VGKLKDYMKRNTEGRDGEEGGNDDVRAEKLVLIRIEADPRLCIISSISARFFFQSWPWRSTIRYGDCLLGYRIGKKVFLFLLAQVGGYLQPKVRATPSRRSCFS